MINIQQILNISESAICGPLERQVNVKAPNVEATKRMLKKAGFIIVGQSPVGPFGKVKVWFNRIGGL